MRHIIPISGKDSLATAIWQRAHAPDLPYEFVFNDTRAELPETYDWLDKVEKTLGIKILRMGKNLEQVIENEGIIPSVRTRFCTKLAKIFPMRDFVGKEGAIVYFGLRADEPDRIGALPTKNLTPRYPLREAGIGLATVYRLVRDLLPPNFFWQRLYDAVSQMYGETLESTLATLPQWKIDRLFAWRSRPNCYFCFFQRRYEWVGLLEHHPILFAAAERIEKETGNGEGVRRSSGIHWIAEDVPLSEIRRRSQEIFEKRVLAVCKLIGQTAERPIAEGFLDEMEEAGTSCGLLCGK